jgi:HK97 family phage prohead protease
MKGRTFVGYAGVHGPVADLGEFTESVIFPAFRDVLERQRENVPFLYDHDGAPLATLARRDAAALARHQGLHVELDLPRHHISVNMLTEQIERGEVRGMSWGFVTSRDQSEIEYTGGKPHRRLMGFRRILDVSPTWEPAYADTLEAFNRESRARDGRRADCRECQHETARAIYTRARARSVA